MDRGRSFAWRAAIGDDFRREVRGEYGGLYTRQDWPEFAWFSQDLADQRPAVRHRQGRFNGAATPDPVLKAAIAHMLFATIHPSPTAE
jgi:hypothetical protein